MRRSRHQPLSNVFSPSKATDWTLLLIILSSTERLFEGFWWVYNSQRGQELLWAGLVQNSLNLVLGARMQTHPLNDPFHQPTSHTLEHQRTSHHPRPAAVLCSGLSCWRLGSSSWGNQEAKLSPVIVACTSSSSPRLVFSSQYASLSSQTARLKS